MLRPVCVLAVLGLCGDALANPASIVPGGRDPELTDSADPEKRLHIVTDVDYEYELDSSTLVREHVGNPAADPLDGVGTASELTFEQVRHTVTPRVQIGVFHDTFVSVALPIVINQARELRFINSNRAGSSTVRDGLVPATGFDARDPGTPTPGDLLFRGPNRHGLDQIHLGLGAALMNQHEDDTKPTWKLGAKVRLAVGTIMKFDPMRPEANKGVSRGVQELELWTSFDRKLGWAEPWIKLWWRVPLTAKSDSLFDDPGFGATNTKSSQLAGVESGLEVYALDNKADKIRISLDIGNKVVAHFEGREYTEMWEVFAFAGDSRGTGPLVLDADPTTDGVQPISHPGISNIENYLELTGRFALRAQIGPHVRFALAGDLIWRTDHAISFADAGVDRDDAGDLVNPGTDEVNPLHAPVIDLVGHRYRSVDGFDIVIGVNGQVLF